MLRAGQQQLLGHNAACQELLQSRFKSNTVCLASLCDLHTPSSMPCAELRCLFVQGMLQSEALGRFYKDLRDPNVESSYAVYHRRFSTNTNPKWPLAQPMRVLGHNGELPGLRVQTAVASAGCAVNAGTFKLQTGTLLHTRISCRCRAPRTHCVKGRLT